MNNKYIVGIDTSAYTTSFSIVDYEGKILYDTRKVLNVVNGHIGLRQQEAVFQHLSNISEITKDVNIDINKIDLISVSNAPRSIEGSYMPVFSVGNNFASFLSNITGTRLIQYSHQEGHIASAFINNIDNIDDVFLSIHISGGTTEFLLTNKKEKGFETKIVGGTKDITFGQLIDRTGAFLGFSFPSGKEMEKYINKSVAQIKMPKVSGDSFINLSGIENYIKDKSKNNDILSEQIIISLFKYVEKCIIHIIEEISKKYSFNSIVITGGVASNSYIRNGLEKNLDKKYNIVFPNKIFCSDNAVGTAFLPIIDRWYNEIKSN